MAAPRLMILDDPAHDLPPDAAGVLFDLLTRIHRPSQAGASGQGLAILLMGRPSAAACRVASRRYVLHEGRILETEAP
jgi:ABC-type branched-subunit amino acid transport system ATPase component